jgi:hypothetical protein
LAASDEPFDGERGQRLVKGLTFLLGKQKDGKFVSQGSNWIHGQGFATLALSEAYGRSLRAKVQPDLDMKTVRRVVEQAVAEIAKAQSTSGGWWYWPGRPGSHEGSTTCCAVQAIDAEVLSRGFEYLKKCQNRDGGFDYMLGPTETSMKEGTAGGVATLGLMRKFDYAVMMNGCEFLVRSTPGSITQQRFLHYGHFYGMMGMRLLGQEMEHLRKKTGAYVEGALSELLKLQLEDGSWPVTTWMKARESADYSTAFATLTLSVVDGRLSVFNRRKPELVEEPAATSAATP